MGGGDTQTLTAIIQFEENKAKATTMVTARAIRETLQATKGTLSSSHQKYFRYCENFLIEKRENDYQASAAI